MKKPLEFEDIAALRRDAGIDDVDLRRAVEGLRVGDIVRLTVLGDAKALGAVLVRVTSINGAGYRGSVAGLPARAAATGLRLGSPVSFTPAHIHSIASKAGGDGRATPRRRTSSC